MQLPVRDSSLALLFLISLIVHNWRSLTYHYQQCTLIPLIVHYWVDSSSTYYDHTVRDLSLALLFFILLIVHNWRSYRSRWHQQCCLLPPIVYDWVDLSLAQCPLTGHSLFFVFHFNFILILSLFVVPLSLLTILLIL